MDGIRAQPYVNPLFGSANDLIGGLLGYMRDPNRTQQLQGLAGLLQSTGIPKSIERLAYGEPLTNVQKANVPALRPETAEALMTLLPVPSGANKAAMAAGRAGERLAERVVPQIMERGGMPASLLGDLSQQTVSPLTVWHGSPHKFSKFDASKIGTGEGAQAYGHGLYVAESPAVAKEYSKLDPAGGMIQPPIRTVFGKEVEPGTGQYKAASLLDSMTLPQARKMVKGWVANARPEEAAYFNDVADTLASITKKSDVKQMAPGGNLYKIDLPDEQIAKMLDWDKPFNEQPKNVQEFFANHPAVIERLSQINAERTKLNELYPGRLTNPKLKDIVGKETTVDSLKGSKLYEILTSGASIGKDEAARVDAMRQAGVPGIRYLDQGSRGTGQGTSNFVVFPGNEDILRILERNGGLLGP